MLRARPPTYCLLVNTHYPHIVFGTLYCRRDVLKFAGGSTLIHTSCAETCSSSRVVPHFFTHNVQGRAQVRGSHHLVCGRPGHGQGGHAATSFYAPYNTR